MRDDNGKIGLFSTLDLDPKASLGTAGKRDMSQPSQTHMHLVDHEVVFVQNNPHVEQFGSSHKLHPASALRRKRQDVLRVCVCVCVCVWVFC